MSGSGTDVRFYRYADAQGQIHLVDAVEKVPEALRAKAEVITLGERKLWKVEDGAHQFITDSLESLPATLRAKAESLSLDDAKNAWTRVGQTAQVIERKAGDLWPFFKDLDPLSVGVGFGLGLAVFLVWTIVASAGRWMMRLALLGLVASLLGGSYWGWVSGLGLPAVEREQR